MNCGSLYVQLTVTVTAPGARIGFGASVAAASSGNSTGRHYRQFNSNGTFGIGTGFKTGDYEIWASSGNLSRVAVSCVNFSWYDNCPRPEHHSAESSFRV
jgi:hypothetical protein